MIRVGNGTYKISNQTWKVQQGVAAPITLNTDLKLYLNFDEVSGSGFVNQVDNTVFTSYAATNGLVTGILGSGISGSTQTTASTDLFSVGTNGASNSYTINFWFKEETPIFMNALEAVDVSEIGVDVILGLAGTDKYNVRFQATTNIDVPNPDLVVEYTGSVTSSNWNMVTVIVDKSGASISPENVSMYMNGTLLTETGSLTAGSCTVSGTENILYEFNGLAPTFLEYLDEFGLWWRTLSQGEITELYNAGSGLSYPF